jgi:hypothetical protein
MYSETCGGVALTRYMDGRTDRVIPIYPPNFVYGGYNNTGTGNQCWMSKVTGFRIHKVFKKRVLKKILGDHKFLLDVTGCQKTQVSDCTSSTV